MLLKLGNPLTQNTNIRRFIVRLSNKTTGFLIFSFICAVFGEDSYQTPRSVKKKEDRKDDFELLLHGIEPGAYKDEDPQEEIEGDDGDGEVFRELLHYGRSTCQ